MKLLKIVMCILTALTIAGCVYTEGDEKAEQSFDLMTSQEKAMHDLVMKEFNEKAVMSVREAVWQRSIKPSENAMPFRDIPGVIKHCNDAILIPRDFWNDEDSIDGAQRAKFSSQDKAWFMKIVKMASGENYEEEEYDTQLPVAEVTNKYEEQAVRTEIKQRIYKEASKLIEEVEVVDQSDLLPLDEYDDIRFLARGCDSAIALVDKAASNERPLTIQDKVDITYQKSICETKKLNDNL